MLPNARRATMSALSTLLSTALFASGCSGTVDRGGGGGNGGGSADQLPSADEIVDNIADDISKDCPADVGLGVSAIRRLSQREYHNTLRDLFVGMNIGRPELAADQNTLGFENRAGDLFATEQNVGDFGSGATDVAAKAVADMGALVPCNKEDSACGAMFIDQFGSRAYRRPLSADEKKRYQDFFDQQLPEIGWKTTVQLTVEGMLQSPHFLYRPELGGKDLGGDRLQVTGYEMANRLSYFIWGSMPDAALFAAAAGGLDTPDVVLGQAQRMLADDKAKTQVVDFYRQWLLFDHVGETLAKEGPKDTTLYPSYGATLVTAMREETDRFAGQVLFDGSRTLHELLTSRETFVNAPLAALYGVDAPAGNEWARVTLPEGERAGLLTQAAFLGGHAHRVSGSPPLRGNYVRTRFLCGPPVSPAPDADTSEPTASAGLGPKTNRQLFEQRLTEGGRGCVSCHTLFDPMGNTFEHYDAIGAYRTQDNGLDVDASGALVLDSGDKEVSDAVGLSAALGDSEEVLSCMTGNWFQFAIGRNSTDEESCKVTSLTRALRKAGGDIRRLQLTIVAMPDFQQRLAQ